MLTAKDDGPGGTNPPGAWRMCAIAFLSYNLSLGCMMGTFGLLLPEVEAKLHVSRALSSLGMSLVLLGLSLTAPVVGSLVQKYSLRMTMVIGAVMGLAGYVILALSTSIWISLAAYAVLLGPSISTGATVLAPTLVNRWFCVGRGRALGITCSPLLMAAIPLIVASFLGRHGLSATYFLLAGLMAVLLVPLSFIVDHPPGAGPGGRSPAADQHTVNAGMTVAELLRRPRFWTLALSSAVVITGATILATHLVPMTEGWGIDATRAAGLLTVSSLVGMVGSIAVGWIADRIGGAATLALLCLINGACWGSFLLEPNYGALMAIAGLLGAFSASVVPAFGVALTQQFGAETFGRALGLGMLIALPFSFVGAPSMGAVYQTTHSYVDGLIGLVALFIVGTLLALAAVKRPAATVAVPAG